MDRLTNTAGRQIIFKMEQTMTTITIIPAEGMLSQFFIFIQFSCRRAKEKRLTF